MATLAIDKNSIPWYCLDTVLPCLGSNTMLLWKYYKYVSTKALKVLLLKKASNKEEIMRLHRDSIPKRSQKTFSRAAFLNFVLKILDKGHSFQYYISCH